MEEISRYAVGVDIGTGTVRSVVASIDNSGTPTIVGFSETPNSGMRKGVVVYLAGPGRAIDTALGEVERMSGYEVNEATFNINGTHITSTKTDGMIAMSSPDHQIDDSDLDRLEDVAATGKIPPNRDILELVPYSYRLDGQSTIKDPIGMSGMRLEIRANVISALTPHCQNITKAAELAHVSANRLVASPVAAARAVLTERQLENGVAIIDLGASTTSLAMFEEGDLQYASVLPYGSNNITNDLAMGLKTDPEIAEDIKVHHASATPSEDHKDVLIKQGKEELAFSRVEIDEIVEARLEEIFDGIRKELKKAGYDRKLPEGIVLVGGGANLRNIVEYAKSKLELSVKVGKPSGFAGVGEGVEKPEFAVSVGLMLIDTQNGTGNSTSANKKSRSKGNGKKIINRIFRKIKF